MKHKHDWDLIDQLSDGKRKSREIAEIIGDGCTAKYIQKVWSKNPSMKRPRQAPPSGKSNPAYKDGKYIGQDGYTLVSAPPDHPYAKTRPGRRSCQIYEHRMVLEKMLGRYLLKTEVVDHIDGCTIHNAPENLRLFSSNKDHLKATLTGKVPDWSEKGFERMHLPLKARVSEEQIDIHKFRKKSGAIRILQILRAHELLDKDSPFLLGTERYLDKVKVCVEHFLNSKLSAKEYLQQQLSHLWYPQE